MSNGIKPDINKKELCARQTAGALAYIEYVADEILNSVGGTLNAESMGRLNGSQITLIAYLMMRGELMEGGFIQLIHNGYGPFIFENPFAKAMRLWGLKELCNMIYDVRKLYDKDKAQLVSDCTDEEFMALYEQYERYDEYDDEFVDNELGYTETIATYVGDHIDEFANLI